MSTPEVLENAEQKALDALVRAGFPRDMAQLLGHPIYVKVGFGYGDFFTTITSIGRKTQLGLILCVGHPGLMGAGRILYLAYNRQGWYLRLKGDMTIGQLFLAPSWIH